MKVIPAVCCAYTEEFFQARGILSIPCRWKYFNAEEKRITTRFIFSIMHLML